jgi:Zn-dependent protease/CBS domain-containing protein
MKATIKLGRIFRIEIGLHYTWFIIAVLMTISLSNLFAIMHPSWGSSLTLLVAATTAIMFFITLLLHELSHCAVAKAFGIPVQSITLFALGGVSNMEKEASSAKAEFWMGVIGPITSFCIGVVCLSGAIALGWEVHEAQTASPLASALAWLGRINIMLAFFNLIPGFPLDGGRVLKAIIWSITKQQEKSALIAAYVGKVAALLLIVSGFALMLGSGTFGGVWFVLLGWFLSTAAESSVIEYRLRSCLKNIRTADAMSHEWPTVAADTTLDEFVKTQVAISGHRYYFVDEPGNAQSIIGLVTPHEIARIEHDKWSRTLVKDVMVPMSRLCGTSPDTPIFEALETMTKENVEQLPIIDDSKLVGILTRANVIELFQTRMELGFKAA